MMGHGARLVVVGWVCVATLAPAAASAQWPFGARKPNYERYRHDSGRMAVEYPKDWRIAEGTGAAHLVSFTHEKGEAAVTIEREELRVAIDPQNLDGTAVGSEVKRLKDHRPEARDVKGELAQVRGTRAIVLTYMTTSPAGPERVRQVAVIAGREVYRITCAALDGRWARHEAAFTYIVDSFIAPAPARTAPGS